MLPDGSFTISTPSGKDYNYKLLNHLTFDCSLYIDDIYMSRVNIVDLAMKAESKDVESIKDMISKLPLMFNQNQWFNIISMQTFPQMLPEHYRYLLPEEGNEIKKKLKPLIDPLQVVSRLTKELAESIPNSKENMSA